MNDSTKEESMWRMGLRDLIKKHPFVSILIVVVSLIAWHFVIGPAVDAGINKIPNSAPARVHTEVAPQIQTVAMAPDCGAGVGCTPRSAARKFRKGRIHHADGLKVHRTFTRPKVSKRILVKKFKRLIHRRYHSARAVGARTMQREASSTSCTADTYACARQWYQRAKEARCSAAGGTYAGGRGKCTEYPKLRFTPATTRQRVRALACVGNAGVIFAPGPGWVRLAIFPGALDNCWSLAD